ncbi:MAG: hypothetical protein Q8O67_16480 [Deltaproteobacteria bacterium]|nr:hypothetical protein [Deltaproteobacteria bacterium]
MKSLALALISAVAVVAATASCNFIRCNDDDDCPAEVPFCNAEICQATAGGERGNEGEGEGEGEGCASDADCGAGLCYDLPDTAAHFDAALVGQCVPGGDDDRSCIEATLFNGSNGDRPTQGTSIFSAAATRRAPVDCGSGQSDLDIVVSYMDREGDFVVGSSLLFVRQNDSFADFASGDVSGDGTSGQGFYIARCVDDAAAHVAVALGQSGATTNALCVSISGAP